MAGLFVLILGGVAVSIFSAVMLQTGLRSMIAHVNIRKAVSSIRAERWDLLVRVIGESSLKWRFYNRPYMIVVGMKAREKLNSGDLASWRARIDQNKTLELQAE